MHTQFKWEFLTWAESALSKSQRLSIIKLPTPGTKRSWLSKRLPKHYRLLLLPLVAPWQWWKGAQRWKASPYCWRHHALQTQGPEAPELEFTWNPSLWGLAFMVQKASCRIAKGGKQPTGLTQLWRLCTTTVTSKNPKGAVVTLIPGC